MAASVVNTVGTLTFHWSKISGILKRPEIKKFDTKVNSVFV